MTQPSVRSFKKNPLTGFMEIEVMFISLIYSNIVRNDIILLNKIARKPGLILLWLDWIYPE
jgi:hypothetical protein